MSHSLGKKERMGMTIYSCLAVLKFTETSVLNCAYIERKFVIYLVQLFDFEIEEKRG